MQAKVFSDFFSYWQQLNWQHFALQLRSCTAKNVEQALAKERLTLVDFMALISPAAEPYLEQMAQQAQRITRQRFGHTVSFYLPLYLSNVCNNDCTYCGFSMHNPIKRKILTREEVMQECEAIKQMGYQSILLVTGEHQQKVGMDYFRQIVPQIRPLFSQLQMEVQPLEQAEYSELKALGLDGVMVYQETYHATAYAKHHRRGNKTNFAYRLATPERLAQAKIERIGLGVLLGLSQDWRTDSYFLAEHLYYLQQRYWQNRYVISFPRLRPCTGGIIPDSLMTERQLLQLICAFRLFAPEVELSLSTRESVVFRDNVVPIAITSVSAGSKTQPGGYANPEKQLDQFSPHDNRSPQQLAKALKQRGLQPIWKDWDSYLGRGVSEDKCVRF